MAPASMGVMPYPKPICPFESWGKRLSSRWLETAGMRLSVVVLSPPRQTAMRGLEGTLAGALGLRRCQGYWWEGRTHN